MLGLKNRFFKIKKKSIARLISVIFTLVTVFGFSLTVVPSPYQNNKEALNASSVDAFIFCSYYLGNGMDASDRWSSGSFLAPYPNASAKGRVWTIQELYSGGVGYVGYQGEDSKDQGSLIMSKGDVPELAGLKTPLSRLQSARTISSCSFGGFTNIAFNGSYNLSSLLSSLTSFVSVSSFDQGLICRGDATTDSPYCIDLVGLIGGKKGL